MVKKTATKKKTTAKKAVAVRKKKTDIVNLHHHPQGTINQLQIVPPSQLISEAVAKGANLEQLKQAMELQERWEANEARKAFSRDMALVQSLIKSVEKTETNDQTGSKYANFDNIVCRTKKIYTEKGFYVSFYEGATDKPEHIRICATVGHTLGHEKEYFYDIPMDGKGLKGTPNMTQIHGKCSSTTYAKRILMCMIWNIPTGDDTDGNVPDKDQQPSKSDYAPPSEEAYKGYPNADNSKGNPSDFHQESEEARATVGFPISQGELTDFIKKAVGNKYLPDDIAKMFHDLGYKFKGKMRLSLKVEDFKKPFIRDDYKSLMENIKEEKKNEAKK